MFAALRAQEADTIRGLMCSGRENPPLLDDLVAGIAAARPLKRAVVTGDSATQVGEVTLTDSRTTRLEVVLQRDRTAGRSAWCLSELTL